MAVPANHKLQAAGRDPLDLDDDQPRTMLQAAHHPNVQHLMAEESMKPLKCPSPVTVAAAHIAAKHGMVVKMRGTMGSPAGQAPGDSEASGGENDATFFVFEDDKENVDPKTGVSARLSSGAGSRSGARPTILSRAGDFWGEILVFFGCSPNVSRAKN